MNIKISWGLGDPIYLTFHDIQLTVGLVEKNTRKLRDEGYDTPSIIAPYAATATGRAGHASSRLQIWWNLEDPTKLFH